MPSTSFPFLVAVLFSSEEPGSPCLQRLAQESMRQDFLEETEYMERPDRLETAEISMGHHNLNPIKLCFLASRVSQARVRLDYGQWHEGSKGGAVEVGYDLSRVIQNTLSGKGGWDDWNTKILGEGWRLMLLVVFFCFFLQDSGWFLIVMDCVYLCTCKGVSIYTYCICIYIYTYRLHLDTSVPPSTVSTGEASVVSMALKSETLQLWNEPCA